MAFNNQPAGGAAPSPREIPFNYTSADDRQAVSFLLGEETVRTLDELRSARVTGRSARILMRLFGEVLIHRRNPYLFQELVASAPRRKRFFEHASKDLETIASKAEADPRVLEHPRPVPRSDCFLPHRGRGDSRAAQSHQARACGRHWCAQRSLRSLHPRGPRHRRHRLASCIFPLAVVTPDERAGGAAAAGHRSPRTQGRSPWSRNRIDRRRGALAPRCIVVNTEKLNHIRSISQREFHLEDGRTVTAHVMEAEAGVITEKAMEHAAEHGLVFATDPTSAWACTVGGNIAENAGGKIAVRWGTCIDNLM